MITISGNLVAQYSSLTSSVVQAFLPLLAAIVGLFMAFAIGKQLKGFIMRMVSRV